MTDQPILTLNDGHAFPQVGYGVFLVPPPETEQLVTDAINVGYKHIDTATFYRNEAAVGNAVRASGKDIFVTTKLLKEELGYDSALRAFDLSYKELGLDVIDLYLIHWPRPHLDLYVETWKAFIRLKEEGRVASIGVSNFTAAHLERVIHDTGIVPVVNQVELHPRFQQVELRAFHEENGIVTTSWSPLGRGAMLDDAAIAGIAAKHGRAPAQIILRWHIENGLSIIPKSSSKARQAENLALFDFALDADDMRAIAALDTADGRIGPDPDNF